MSYTPNGQRPYAPTGPTRIDDDDTPNGIKKVIYSSSYYTDTEQNTNSDARPTLIADKS